jgi:AcrR family transcriptional regulator
MLSTHDKLLNAAYSLIEKEGFEAITAAKITTQADLGYGTFYKYFKSTEDIFKEVFRQKLKAVSEKIFAMNQNEDDKLYGYLKGHALIFYYICEGKYTNWIMERPNYFIEIISDAAREHATNDLREAILANQLDQSSFLEFEEEMFALDVWLIIGALDLIEKGSERNKVCRSLLRYVAPQVLSASLTESLIDNILLNVETDLHQLLN